MGVNKIDNHIANNSKIGNAIFKIDILPKGHCIPNTKIKPTSITIHNTGNINTSAKSNHNYMKNINKSGERIASWHFTVDDEYIYKAQSTNYKCYHAGCSKGNNSSIGIEVCMFNDAQRQLKAYENAIELVKIIMDYYNFDSSNVKRHYDWTLKHCPQFLIEGKYGYTWTWFISMLKDKPFSPYLVRINTASLNVREQPSIKYKVNTVVRIGEVYTIVEEKNGWGKLKSGAGWINLYYTERL